MFVPPSPTVSVMPGLPSMSQSSHPGVLPEACWDAVGIAWLGSV